MAGYFGNELQKRLQQRAEDMHVWASQTPGACDAARMLGTDDPERLGFETIFDVLKTDSLFGFRLISKSCAAIVAELCVQRGYKFDTWDVYTANAQKIRGATTEILAQGLPSGFTMLDKLESPDAALALMFQEFVAKAGIAPFSRSYLCNQFARSAAVGILDEAGKLAAAAFTYMPHNIHSPYHSYAWGGLVAVDDSHRGRGLGTLVNAMMANVALDVLGATHLYELVSSTNTPSKKMVERSGLRLDPDLVSGLATVSNKRFTR